MLRKCIVCSLLAFVSIVHALDKEQNKRGIGSIYQNFLDFAGSESIDCSMIEAKASLLFAENFRKIVNNQIVLEGRDKLGPYLWNFRENLGRWKISPDVYTLITSKDDFSFITLTYKVDTIDRLEPISLIVIAILKVDSDNKIVEIFEVDHSIADL